MKSESMKFDPKHDARFRRNGRGMLIGWECPRCLHINPGLRVQRCHCGFVPRNARRALHHEISKLKAKYERLSP